MLGADALNIRARREKNPKSKSGLISNSGSSATPNYKGCKLHLVFLKAQDDRDTHEIFVEMVHLLESMS